MFSSDEDRWHVQDTDNIIGTKETGIIAHWHSTWLEFMKPWVPSLALQKMNYNILNSKLENKLYFSCSALFLPPENLSYYHIGIL